MKRKSRSPKVASENMSPVSTWSAGAAMQRPQSAVGIQKWSAPLLRSKCLCQPRLGSVALVLCTVTSCSSRESPASLSSGRCS